MQLIQPQCDIIYLVSFKYPPNTCVLVANEPVDSSFHFCKLGC